MNSNWMNVNFFFSIFEKYLWLWSQNDVYVHKIDDLLDLMFKNNFDLQAVKCLMYLYYS